MARRDRGRWLLIVVVPSSILAAVFLLITPRRPVKPMAEGLTSPALTGLAARCEAAWAEEQATVAGTDRDLVLLDDALRVRTRAELKVLEGSPGADAQVRQATARCQELMGDLLARRGAKWYRAAGVLLGGRMVSAMTKALAEAKRLGDLEAYLRSRDLDRGSFEDLYGSFLLGVAVPSRLVMPDGTWDELLPGFARVIFLYRWIREARLLKGGDLSLTRDERRLYLHWKVERAIPATRESRLAALEELARLEPGYPVDSARALIWKQAIHTHREE